MPCFSNCSPTEESELRSSSKASPYAGERRVQARRDSWIDQIADLRLEAEAVLLEMSVMAWRGHEYGEPVNFRSVLRGHKRLTSAETVRLVKRAAAACDDPTEKRALDYLLMFVVSLFVGERTAAHHDRILNATARARVQLDGRSVPYRALQLRIANEPDRARRQKIHSLAMGVVRRFNPQYARLWRLEHGVPREIGYTYLRLSEAHRRVRLRDIAALARQVLDQTEEIHRQLLDEQSRTQLGCGSDRLRRSDMPRLLKHVAVERCFPADRLVAMAERTARNLGFDLRQMGNLRIFAEERPNKVPRAMCCPLKVPDDVRLSVRPVGGVADYRTLLHEMGHGLHFATTATKRFEFQHLGAGAVTETYAFLLEHLIENRHWLAAHGRLSEREIAAQLRFSAFSRIYSMRRYAAKILYEVHLHSGRKRPREAYRRLLSRAYGFPLTNEDAMTYLSDVDPTFYAADYFRAWLAEAILTEHLEERFGPRWFERKAAGRFLAKVWALGNQMTVEELLAQLGARQYSIASWLRRVRALLGG